ncbi:MAG: SIR2 family protein [Sulfurospirillum sp.]|nr:SIR2 family protein [Sulfurospirillum sp.]
MKIKEFISNYNNHPVLFIGTGISLRYLKNSYTWNGLLKKVAFELTDNEEFYLDLKSKCYQNDTYQYEKIAALLEEEFNTLLSKDRNGKFKEINDIFYENMQEDINLSRFKIYISQLLSDLEHKDNMIDEIAELKKIRKNISSIITTNYDKFIEEIFNFNPLIGNDILLSNPYGSVYKIHGCISKQNNIIFTEDDYKIFFEKYELIRAQLLSLFIHNPIIFMGYSISDDNIKNILKTIFTYIEPNSEQAERIRNNFLLVEYEKNSTSDEIVEHDVDLEGFSTIRINKLKTDDFIPIYTALSNLHLSVSAMDIRKVQNIVKEIYSGGEIKVSITDNLDEVSNDEKILAIGSVNTIKYVYQNKSEMISNYFQIIDESNSQVLKLIDKYSIQKQQFFPIYGFSKINVNIQNITNLKNQQKNKLDSILNSTSHNKFSNSHNSIELIYNDETIVRSSRVDALVWSIMKNSINLSEVRSYLEQFSNKKETNYRKLLCAYDYQKYK